MANGDAAAAAGMAVVSGTAQVKLGYDEINKSRDYIAQRASRAGLDIYVQSADPGLPRKAGRVWIHPAP